MKKDRVEILAEIVQKRKKVSVKELAELTFSSVSTLRRDLIYLEQQGVIRRHHGEVVLNSANVVEPSHYVREGQHIQEKKSIASIAKDFIGPGMCLFLDASTTVYELCPYLADIDYLIIFTNGLRTAQYLSELSNPTMKLFITGGEIKQNSASITTLTNDHQLMEQFSVDLAFCSARGIDEAYTYEASLSNAISKQMILNQAHESILLIDSSKYYKKGVFKLHPIDYYSVIISDHTPPLALTTAADHKGVEWLFND